MNRRQVSTSMTRRQILRAAGAGAAAITLPALPAIAAERTAPDLRARARKNLTLGIFTSVYADLPLEEAAKRIRQDGFSCVVFDYRFKDVAFDPLRPDWDVLQKITACLERNDIRIAGLYGYYNVIDPDPAKRRRGEERMDLLIRNWKRFGCPIISTETGTYNTQSEFMESPENFTEKGYAACRAAFEKLVGAAEKTRAVIAIETYWRNVICSVDRTAQLFRDINSPSLKLTMDPCNYFRNEDLPKMKPMLEEIFQRVGRQTVLAHAKDVKRSEKGPDLPAAGLGELDYPLYLRLLAQLDRPLDLVIEHLGIQDVARARDYVKAQMEKI
ncbi:MAG: sugar phosphate isomerase/epimerase family protein [Phycisphaerae bacterium]